MTKILILIIINYQKWVSPVLKQILGIKTFCRFEKTCSEYAKEAIEEKGVMLGGAMATKRIFSCNPFSKSYTSAI